ncbi:MAG: hypothetical protein CBC48_05380 [bacterium TMED88]|nr:MAG: hypothetical protein CBC48_05380 [bacterium TMED88]
MSTTTGEAIELKAVNGILASVGQAPVTTLDQTNPDVAICYQTLLDVSRQVQAEGWTFNTEYNLPLNINTNKTVTIPNNTLQISLATSHPEYGDKDGVRRSQQGVPYLYDRVGHTFNWSGTNVYVDIVSLIEWADLPLPFQAYVTARASTIVSQRLISDPTLYQMLTQQEAYLRAEAMEYECSQGKHTFFGHPPGQNYYTPYQPFHALYR